MLLQAPIANIGWSGGEGEGWHEGEGGKDMDGKEKGRGKEKRTKEKGQEEMKENWDSGI